MIVHDRTSSPAARSRQRSQRPANAEKLKHLRPCVTLSETVRTYRLLLLIPEFLIDAAEVLHLERLLFTQAVGNDPQPVAPGAAPAHEFQRRQNLPSAELRHEKAMIENAATVAVSANHFAHRTVPDEIVDRLPVYFFLSRRTRAGAGRARGFDTLEVR